MDLFDDDEFLMLLLMRRSNLRKVASKKPRRRNYCVMTYSQEGLMRLISFHVGNGFTSD